MTQWFRGNIEGYYVGKPDRVGVSTTANGKGFQIVVYRAAIFDVELLEFIPPAPFESPVSDDTKALKSGEEVQSEEPPLRLPSWLPAPGTAFFQPKITDARLFPLRHAMGWFEGPVHHVYIEQFQSTHAKQHGENLYGRFVGRVHGYFALPPEPRPEAAKRLVQAFQDLPDDELPPDDLSRDPATPLQRLYDTPAAQRLTASILEGADQDRTRPGSPSYDGPGMPPNDADLQSARVQSPDTAAAAKAAVETMGPRVPFLILVILVAIGLLITCGAPRALLWLFFLLPTLLVRRIVGNAIPDSTALRGFSALLTLGQAWLAAMVFVGWWESGCRDVHPSPLIGTLIALAVASVIPFDIPLLVNASTLAALLFGWCTGKDSCTGETQSLHSRSYDSPIVVHVEDDRS